MKMFATRYVVALYAVASGLLAGCMPPPSNSTAPDPSSVNKIRADDAAIMQSVSKGREDYVSAHPDSAYNIDVEHGLIVVGMSRDEVAAAGYRCEVKEGSTIGNTQTCTNQMLQAKIDATWAGATSPDFERKAPTHYVSFNTDGKVESVSY
ncbi:hypothetical protein IHE49_03080 [Rhodanobacter sp. 7MK24]|uniref:hypothetical protein n=1 Tax=Rhodanobacter sp. 7MK24 TaxID=2775922 RepID=UPI00177E1961|nr:hypothetical protein [Rhodanobacter sp. 7MK24]MBD8879458.1 hypothetical protein [Rhodanobacter sp. 7MK24]